MENKTPYPEIFLAVEEAIGKTPTNGEIDDFVTELAKRGITLVQWFTKNETPPEGSDLLISDGTTILTSEWNYSNGFVSGEGSNTPYPWIGIPEDWRWCKLPTAPKSENNS